MSEFHSLTEIDKTIDFPTTLGSFPISPER